jgi:hypothetical protein
MMGQWRLRVMAALCVAALSVTSPASAADPVFLPLARIGLVPPSGFVISKQFPGFEDAERKSGFLLRELPADSYAELEKTPPDELMKPSGATVETSSPFTLASGPAFLVVARKSANGLDLREWVLVASAPEFTAVVSVQVPVTESNTYPDDVIVAALSTVTFRNVPVEEQLAVLPFAMNDLAGFRLVRATPESAVLTDGPKDLFDLTEQSLIMVAVARGAPSDADSRPRFARAVFANTPGIKDTRLTRAEPQRVGGQPGYEIMANAKDMKTGTDVNLVQWLRFGTSGYLQIIGVTRKDNWAVAFPRFRAIRDGVDPK